MGEAQFRNKVTWFSFVFSLLVVWIHAYNAELFLGKGNVSAMAAGLEMMLGEGIGQIVVPGFFMISGYLFFYHFSWDQLYGKWERRIRSVLVPYILWNFLYYIGYVIGSRLPWVKEVVGKGTVPLNLHELVEALLNYKYNVVFWYLYQLILLILLAPALYMALKWFWGRGLFFVVLGGMLIFDVRLPLLNTDALFYYAAAAAVALADSPWVRDPDILVLGGARKARIRRMAQGAAALALAVFLNQMGLAFSMPAGLVGSRLLAVTGLWLLVPGRVLPPAGDVIHGSFFLYTTHFALVRFINKAMAKLFAPTRIFAVPLLLYFAMPGIVLCISSACVKILRRLSPRLCTILNGGR